MILGIFLRKIRLHLTYITNKWEQKSQMDNDKQLLYRLRKSDPAAFKDLYCQYYDWLLLVADVHLPYENAEKVVEDFLLGCWKSQSFKTVHTPLRIFLFNTLVAHCKKRHPEKLVVL